MKIPGYWVEKSTEGVSLTRTLFDETELDPATDWKEAWQNQDPDATVRGYVPIEAALSHARTLLPEDISVDVADTLPTSSDDVLSFRSRLEIELFAKGLLGPGTQVRSPDSQAVQHVSSVARLVSPDHA